MKSLMNSQEQAQGFAERVSIAANPGIGFLPRGQVRSLPKSISGELSIMAEKVNPSGPTDEESHQYFIQGYLLWAVGALFANSLVWIWRPWF